MRAIAEVGGTTWTVPGLLLLVDTLHWRAVGFAPLQKSVAPFGKCLASSQSSALR